MFITSVMYGYGLSAIRRNSWIEITFLFTRGAASDSDVLLPSSAGTALGVGTLTWALVLILVFEVLVEARAWV